MTSAMPCPLGFLLCVMVLFVPVLGCASADEPRPPQAPIDGTAGDASTICEGAAATRGSLEEWVTSITFLDEAAYRQSYEETRENLTDLARSAEGTVYQEQVATLNASVVKLQQALSQPQLAGTGPAVRTQINQIEANLVAIENTAGCTA